MADLMDSIIQLSVIAFGYVIGGGLSIVMLRLMGFPLGFSHATLLVLILPLVTTLLTEMFTGLWERTPGSLGFGGLIVFYPMLIAGAAIVMLSSPGDLSSAQVMKPTPTRSPAARAIGAEMIGMVNPGEVSSARSGYAHEARQQLSRHHLLPAQRRGALALAALRSRS